MRHYPGYTTRAKRVYRFAFWTFFFVLTCALLAPQQHLPNHKIINVGDKTQHTFVFFILSVSYFYAYHQKNNTTNICLVIFIIYGGLVEVLQSLSNWRHGDWRDWLADALGVAVAKLLLVASQRYRDPVER
jgi:VanZ family protein